MGSKVVGFRFLPHFSASTRPAVLAFPLLLLHVLLLWKRSRWTSVSGQKPPHKGVFNVSSISTREGSDGSSNAQEEMAQTSLRKERFCYKRTI